jgi:hypothetical protein
MIKEQNIGSKSHTVICARVWTVKSFAVCCIPTKADCLRHNGMETPEGS